MKELVIGFLVALFVSSYINSGGPTPYQNGWTFGNAAVGPDPIVDVNTGTFQGEVLDSHTPVLAAFVTAGDAHCENMKPALTQLGNEGQGFVRIVRIDGTSSPSLTSRYDIRSYPSFVLFKDAKAVNGTAGEMTKKDLENWVKRELDVPIN